MDTDHREHSVMVWGEPHIVTVYRKSETVYEAIGNYMCETICVNDQSEGAAIKRWREAAVGVSPSEQLTRGAG
jgi:predicted transcriptional regulator